MGLPSTSREGFRWWRIVAQVGQLRHQKPGDFRGAGGCSGTSRVPSCGPPGSALYLAPAAPFVAAIRAGSLRMVMGTQGSFGKHLEHLLSRVEVLQHAVAQLYVEMQA